MTSNDMEYSFYKKFVKVTEQNRQLQPLTIKDCKLGKRQNLIYYIIIFAYPIFKKNRNTNNTKK